MRPTDSGASDTTRRMLEERAQRLARPIEPEASVGREVELLHFDLAQERYAIETSFVRRITRVSRVSRIAGLPAYFAGVMNLHGEIVAVVDLCTLIGIEPGAQNESSRTIILGRNRAEFGIVADGIAEIAAAPMDLLASPATERSEQAFVRGILLDGVIVLDGASLLDDARLFISENVHPILSREKAE